MEVVLFYIYTPLGNTAAVARLKHEFRTFTTEKKMTGRLLLSGEGINGTVAAYPENMVEFKSFFVGLIPAAALMPWKLSRSEGAPFIDMKIQICEELVGWGFGVDMATSDNVSHLDPPQFHEMLTKKRDKDVVIMDMRNYQESALGHFKDALLPKSKNMPDLGHFLEEQARNVENKTVLMYCTGGIRCEKASLYLDRISEGKAKHIYQLRGGIHEYLEAFGSAEDCQFIGKNFVFDRRGFVGEGVTAVNESVGKCESCQTADPVLTGCAVCVVCRFQILLCTPCLEKNGGEHFCFSHKDLSDCYSMHRIPSFSKAELHVRIAALQEKEKALLPLGRKGRNRRRTIRLCWKKMDNAMSRAPETSQPGVAICRSSGKPLKECPGDCWGFFGRADGPEADSRGRRKRKHANVDLSSTSDTEQLAQLEQRRTRAVS